MGCPYCASEIPETALVCSVCHRDLFLVKQLSERIAELEAALAKRPEPVAAVDSTTVTGVGDAPAEGEALALAEQNLAAKGSWWQGLLYWLTPLLLLLVAHWLIVFVYDTKVLYLRVLALLVPLPFGFLFARALRWRFSWNLVPAFLMAGIAVFGMSAITGWLDSVPILPENMVDVREFIEFAASIGFSFVTGLWAQAWLQRRDEQRALKLLELRRRLGPLAAVNSQQMADSLTRLNDIGSAVIGVATSAVSIYTGLKGFLGN